MDYVVAGAESKNIPDFLNHLWKVRYHGNAVEYDTRNHFFTQWVEHNPQIDDITAQVCPHVVRKTMVLNRKPNGKPWVPEIPESRKEVTYIPLEDITSGACHPQFLTDDFVGLVPRRSSEQGMDARHVGMVVRDGDYVGLRHVSYKGKAWEDGFTSYIKSYRSLFSGVIVARYSSP